MMSNWSVAVFFWLCASNLHIEAKPWSFDQRFGRAMDLDQRWNSINGGSFASRPALKYPMAAQQSTIGNYAYGNFIQKPIEIIIDRPLPQVHYRQPLNIAYKQPTTSSPNPRKKTHLPRPVQQQNGFSNFEEYLLHAQMPLPLATTFVMTNRADSTEPEFLT